MNKIVTIEYINKHIAKVAIENKDFRNMITQELQKDLIDTFFEIRQNSDVKVVIVHGYEEYFCTGGAYNSLKQFISNKPDYSTFPMFRALLDCEVPVIAAIQGHTFGAGLPFALYADILVMSETAKYSANFMSFGFTPGAGATYIVPKKLGILLGTEMLYSARYYTGLELKNRGASAIFAPAEQVIGRALRLAKDLAVMPKKSLTLFKEHMTCDIKMKLVSVLEAESKMQQISMNTDECKIMLNQFFNNPQANKNDE